MNPPYSIETERFQNPCHNLSNGELVIHQQHVRPSQPLAGSGAGALGHVCVVAGSSSVSVLPKAGLAFHRSAP